MTLLAILSISLVLFSFSIKTTTLAQAHCLPDQRDALIQLKQGFNTTQLHSWNTSTDCCIWDGITCDKQTGMVTALELSSRSISGEINPALFNLSSLQNLDLSENYFYNITLPQIGFERLGNLTQLDLSYSGFVGQVPISISALTKLQVLYLDGNNLYLHGTGLKTLLSNLTKLQVLYLNEVDISLNESEWGKAVLQIGTTLQVLSMRDCGLRDQDDSMPESVSNEVAESMHRKMFISKKSLANVGPEFRAIHERVMREPPDKNEFILKIKEGVLQPQPMLINLAFDDLKDLAKQDKLDVSIISIWIIFLKRHVTDLGREADVGFLNPSMISHLHFDTDKVAASSYLLDSLKNMQDKKFILAPYIQGYDCGSGHWLLLIFVLRDNMVYVIDSLPLKEPDYDIMWHFKDIFESYVEAGGVHKEGSKECEWKYIKSPKQEGGKVCGFYVMKHMQDLVTTQFDVFPDCDLPTKKYTPTQLHAITKQWCRFFLDNY